MKRLLSKILMMGALLGVLSGCSTDSSANSTASETTGEVASEATSEAASEAINEVTSDKLQIVATNSILADMAKNVGGDKVDVYSIVPVGTDPHEYEPLPADMEASSNADIVFYNGLNLETGNGWFTKLMETTGKNENEEYFAVSTNVEPQYLTTEGQEGEEDPHAWLDIGNGIIYVQNMTEIISSKDPDNAEYYQSNSEAYIEQLSALDEEAKTKFSDIPESKRLLVTSEGAFKYFSNAYGLTAAYIWEINTEDQGTPDQMSNIIDTIRASAVPVLFLETSVDSRSMEQVAEETGLEIYCKIFTDSLAAEGEEGDTYLGMMEWNINKIHEGLSQ